MNTEALGNHIFVTVLKPYSQKLNIHPVVLIRLLYEKYGEVRTTPKVVSGYL